MGCCSSSSATVGGADPVVVDAQTGTRLNRRFSEEVPLSDAARSRIDRSRGPGGVDFARSATLDRDELRSCEDLGPASRGRWQARRNRRARSVVAAPTPPPRRPLLPGEVAVDGTASARARQQRVSAPAVLLHTYSQKARGRGV